MKPELKKIKIKDLNLTEIKSKALYLYKNNAPDPGKDLSNFLTECWVEAVISELNKKQIVNIQLKRDHQHLIGNK